MAQYALLLNCSTGGSVSENEGVFDSVSWVSTSNSTCPDPSSGPPLSLNPGDTVTFAVQVQDGNGALQTAWLNWIVVMVTAVTVPGNRNNRNANNNSPFRIGSGAKPNTVLLASTDGAGGTDSFIGINAGGNLASGPYQGFPYMTVVADVAPGSSGPSNRPTSQYEAVVVASVTDGTGATWQFGFDPEMDVNNNN